MRVQLRRWRVNYLRVRGMLRFPYMASRLNRPAPALRGASTRHHPTFSVGVAGPSGMHVLDCRLDAGLIEHAMRKDGILSDVVRVDSKADFQTAFVRQKWDLILTDFALPSFDAHEVLRIVRSREPDLPIILVTGTKPDEYGISFTKEGATDYLLKSNLARIGTSIRAALQKRKLQEALRKSRAQVKGLEDRLRSVDRKAASSVAREIRRDLKPEFDAMKLEIVSAVKRKQGITSAPSAQRKSSKRDRDSFDTILSGREMEVVRQMTTGKSLKEIAASLRVSAKSVSTYRQRILIKLRLSSNAELMRFAVEHRFLD